MHKTIYIRHAKSKEAAEGVRDIDRQLSNEGTRSAQALRDKFEKMNIGLVLSSPAARSVMTASLATGLQTHRIHVVPELYAAPDDAAAGSQINELFARQGLGNVPVSTYLNTSGGDVLMQWAEKAKHACAAAAHAAKFPDIVLIFGHAVCLQAVAMYECESSVPLVGKLAGIVLNECEGFAVKYDYTWAKEITML